MSLTVARRRSRRRGRHDRAADDARSHATDVARHVRATVAIGREQLLGEPGRAREALERALDLARVALAAEAVGVAEAVLELTTAYVKDRVQFGRPVGSFQAVKHRLADMMVEVEAARSASWYAACVADERSDELPEAASIAKAACSDAAFNCAAERHPAARRHRLHVGARCPLLFQARSRDLDTARHVRRGTASGSPA